MSPKPKIIYVPGLLPKPQEAIHRAALYRCLIAGIEKADPEVAQQIEADSSCFDIVAWTYDFYGEHRDFELDTASVDALLAQGEVAQVDIDEATTAKKRLSRWILGLADKLPFLIPHVANERMRLHLRDLRRYLQNRNELAEHSRAILKDLLRETRDQQRPILLIAHSMGTVIAYESLWQMARANREAIDIDLLLTMGTPLGQRYIQTRVKGSDAIGDVRYPNNIRRWINLAAVGDLTAVDPTLHTDFGDMLCSNLVESIEDRKTYNWFRLDGVLNPHAEYGYLVNPETAAVVTEWWRSLSSDPDSGE